MMRRAAFLLGAGVLAAGTLAFARPEPPVVEASPHASTAIVARAPAGVVVRLLPGIHPPLRIARALTVEGTPGAVVRGPVEILADGATLRGLTIRGAENGVLVREAEDVILEEVAVRAPTMHGIEIVDGSALVRGCEVSDPAGPQVQALEVRNANGRPRTVVEGCTIRGGMEGLVSHVSRVEFRDNLVEGTTVRGITVTEMSEGLVEGNTVRDAAGAAFYCGDMSHCEIRRNVARGIVDDGSGITSRSGYGAVGWYYSTMRLAENDFRVEAPEPVRVSMGTILTESFPLSIWPPGWVGAVPALWVGGLSLLGLALVRWAVGPWLRRRRSDERPGSASPLALNVLLAGFVVQSFHMLEHGVQVFQVYVAESEVRSGLAGARIDTEWVHFVFNLAVLGFLVWAWRLVRPRGAFGHLVGRGAPWLLAAFVIQTYHFAEHAVKLAQHLAVGVDPAPGIFGKAAGLVWFHFGINLAVYVGMAIPLAALLWRSLRDGSLTIVRAPRRAPALQPEPPVSS